MTKQETVLITELMTALWTKVQVVVVVVTMAVMLVDQQVVELVTEQVSDSWLLSSGEQEWVQGLAEHQPSPPEEQIQVQGQTGLLQP